MDEDGSSRGGKKSGFEYCSKIRIATDPMWGVDSRLEVIPGAQFQRLMLEMPNRRPRGNAEWVAGYTVRSFRGEARLQT